MEILVIFSWAPLTSRIQPPSSPALLRSVPSRASLPPSVVGKEAGADEKDGFGEEGRLRISSRLSESGRLTFPVTFKRNVFASINTSVGPIVSNVLRGSTSRFLLSISAGFMENEFFLREPLGKDLFRLGPGLRSESHRERTQDKTERWEPQERFQEFSTCPHNSTPARRKALKPSYQMYYFTEI